MIFGTFCFFMTFHIFFFYPETANKSLEEIDLVFERNVPAWRSAAVGGTFEDRIEQVKHMKEHPTTSIHQNNAADDKADEKSAPEGGETLHQEAV